MPTLENDVETPIELQARTQAATRQRSEELFGTHLQEISRRTDRLFVGLFLFQWIACILLALWISPQAWAGTSSRVHFHVWLALFFGGGIIAYPILLTFWQPGSVLTRHSVALAQMLTSSLLIHLCGGRMETHFHIFGSLAFLAFYRDWRVLITASAVAAADHFLRGYYLPESIYGTTIAGGWRWLEHAAWVVFEDIFLVISIVQSRREMLSIASRQAELENINSTVEATVIARTAELTRSEESLRESQERYEVAVNGSNEGIWDVDVASGVMYSSPRFKELIGYAEDEFENTITAFMDQLHPDDLDRVMEVALAHLEYDTPYAVDYRLRTKSGDYLWFHARGQALRDETGHAYRMAGSISDITERKLLETQLAHAQKMESIGQLAAGIAHEINTPIQYIGDNLRFLKESFEEWYGVQTEIATLLEEGKNADPSSELAVSLETLLKKSDLEYLFEEIPKAAQQSLDGVERVAKIVQAIKHFSHPGTTEKTLVDINRSIESTITVARNEWKYVAEVVTDFDPDLPLVPCLPGDFNQVILNLLVNASHAIADVVKDSGELGVITVTTHLYDDWLEVLIGDSGTGIPEAARARIFDPFFTTKEVGKGTGQGLSIAHSIIVEKHNGEIRFETETGQGTTFILRLPLDPVHQAHQDEIILAEVA